MASEVPQAPIPNHRGLLEVLHAGTPGCEALNVPQARSILSALQGLEHCSNGCDGCTCMRLEPRLDMFGFCARADDAEANGFLVDNLKFND